MKEHIKVPKKMKRVKIGYCKNCGENVFFYPSNPWSKRYGYLGCYMCGCTVRDVDDDFPEYWVIER